MRNANKQGRWVCIAPIRGLALTDAVNYEYKVDRVTFIAARKLPHVRKRLGLPTTVSAMKMRDRVRLVSNFFLASDTFATMRLTGDLPEQRAKFEELVREELAILAASQLGYGSRRFNASPTLANERPPETVSFLGVNSKDNSLSVRGSVAEKIGDLRLDHQWLRSQRSAFFIDLIRLITNQGPAVKSWVKDIRNAAILVGQSQVSSDLPQAFLWNMIALELLLTEQGDRYREILPRRAEAFIGWAVAWNEDNYEDRIQDLYKKRSAFVHDGNREKIEITDLLFSDTLLRNVLNNIVKHPKLFNSRDAVIEFSRKVEAERLLNIKPKVTPKTFMYVDPLYSERDFEEI